MSGVWLWLSLTVAGGLGALARYGVSGWVQRRLDTTHPFGTAVVNLAGTALLAALVAAWRHGLATDEVLAVAGAGFCAGFTTFSTWMLEMARLGEAGRAGRRAAAADLAGQLLAGVVIAGIILAA